jgi:cation-transporting ATPase G
MGDACCATDIEPDIDGSGTQWQTAAAGAAAAGWAVGVIAGLAGVDGVATAAFVIAIIAGGSTFVPSALRGLRRGRLGVG